MKNFVKHWLVPAAIMALAMLACVGYCHAGTLPVGFGTVSTGTTPPAAVVRFYAGANGAWLNGPGSAFPNDYELGGSASASLSPHISAVGEAFYGFSHAYTRYAGELRATATDTENPNFNAFFGLSYRGGSTLEVGPTELAPTAGFGWKPEPTAWPHLLLGAKAAYGVTSNRIMVAAGLRYVLPFSFF